MATLNSFGNICKKLLSDLYALFLVTVALFFDGPKTPKSVLCMIPLGTFIPSLVSIGKVVSEEKIFERNKTKNSNKKKTLRIGNNSNMA